MLPVTRENTLCMPVPVQQEESGPKLSVDHEAVVFVDGSARAIPERTAPERGFLLYQEGLAGQKVEDIAIPAVRAGHGAAIVPEAMHSGYPIDVRMLIEDLGNGLERPGQVFVVAVQPRHDFAARLAKALVQCVTVPGVALADVIVQPVPVFLDDVLGPVAAAAIDNNIFEVLVVLVENRPKRFFDESCLVEGGRNDGNFQR